jgi:hypothetical protein
VFENPAIAQFWNPATDVGRATLDAMITRQAQIIAYIDDFKLLMVATLAVIPLLMVFKQASEAGRRDHTLAERDGEPHAQYQKTGDDRCPQTQARAIHLASPSFSTPCAHQ